MSADSKIGSNRGEEWETMADGTLGMLGSTEREYVRAQKVDMAELKNFPNADTKYWNVFWRTEWTDCGIQKEIWPAFFKSEECTRLNGNAVNWALENTGTHRVQ